MPAKNYSEYPSTVEVAWNSLKYLNPNTAFRSGEIMFAPAPSPELG